MKKYDQTISYLNNKKIGDVFIIHDIMDAISISYGYALSILNNLASDGYLSFTDNWRHGSRDTRVWRIEKLPIVIEKKPHGNKTGKRFLPISISVPREIKLQLDDMTPEEKRKVIEKGLQP